MRGSSEQRQGYRAMPNPPCSTSGTPRHTSPHVSVQMAGTFSTPYKGHNNINIINITISIFIVMSIVIFIAITIIITITVIINTIRGGVGS